MGRRERRGCRNWGESDFLPSGGSRKPFWMCVWAEIEGSAGFEYRKIGSYLEKYYFGSLDYTSNEIPSPNSLIRNETPGNSLVSQWLGLHALTGKSPDSTLDWGAKILQASRCCQKGRKEATLQMVGNIIKGLCDLEMVKFILSIKKKWKTGDSDGKEFACSAGDPSSILGLGRCPGEGNGYPFQYSCLKNSMDRRA